LIAKKPGIARGRVSGLGAGAAFMPNTTCRPRRGERVAADDAVRRSGGVAAGRLHRSAQVTAVATGTLVGMYVIDLVAKLADPVEPLRCVSAFRYCGSAIQDVIDPYAFAGLTLAGAALAIAGALLLYRRDVLV
jgi:hypothetical protein